mgnify:FL=1
MQSFTILMQGNIPASTGDKMPFAPYHQNTRRITMKKTKKQLISGLTVLGLLTTTILSPVQTGRAQAAAKIKVNKTKITVSIGKPLR